MRLCQGFVLIHDGVVARDVGYDQVSDPAKIGITREWLAKIVVGPGLSSTAKWSPRSIFSSQIYY